LDRIKGKAKKVTSFVKDDLNETRRKARVDLQKSLELDEKSSISRRNNKRAHDIERLDRLYNSLDSHGRARKKR
jgi:hypothetical protein